MAEAEGKGSGTNLETLRGSGVVNVESLDPSLQAQIEKLDPQEIKALVAIHDKIAQGLTPAAKSQLGDGNFFW